MRWLILALVVLFGSAADGVAAEAASCNAYAGEAAAKARGVREFACGFDLNNPRWTTARDAHARWCRTVPSAEVATEAAARRGDVKRCEACRAYARLAVTAMAENTKLACGLSGPRWSKDPAAHFGWCMQPAMSDTARTDSQSREIPAAGVEASINPETALRSRALAQCRAGRADQGRSSKR